MADFATDYNLGEDVLKNAVTEAVEYDATITKGEVLKITAVSAETGIVKVQIATATDKGNFVAMFSGVAGDFKQALKKGLTKLTAGGAIAINDPVRPGAAGKVVTTTRTLPTGAVAVTSDAATPDVNAGFGCGTSYQVPAADLDTFLCFFNGELA